MCFELCKKYARCCFVIVIVIVILLPLFVNCIILPLVVGPQIVVEPQKLDVSLSPGEYFTKTISIGAIGRCNTEVTLTVTEPIDKGVNLSKYLFCWDNVPGKDNETLLRVLRVDFNINWTKNASIFKSDDETINISKGCNSTQIKIDKKKGKATLKISDDNIHNLKVKEENGKRNIYLYSSKINITVVDDRMKYFNVNLNISSNATPGEYRGAIQIRDNDKVKVKIPVFIEIHSTKVQIVGIEAPLKVNESEYFKITAKIKNIGDHDAFGVNASVDLTTAKVLDVVEGESKNEVIAILHKNETVNADWWLKVNQTTTGWKTIKVNLRSKNAGRDTEIIPVKIVNSKKSS